MGEEAKDEVGAMPLAVLPALVEGLPSLREARGFGTLSPNG
jgi:hypothetical protein